MSHQLHGIRALFRYADATECLIDIEACAENVHRKFLNLNADDDMPKVVFSQLYTAEGYPIREIHWWTWGSLSEGKMK